MRGKILWGLLSFICVSVMDFFLLLTSRHRLYCLFRPLSFLQILGLLSLFLPSSLYLNVVLGSLLPLVVDQTYILKLLQSISLHYIVHWVGQSLLIISECLHFEMCLCLCSLYSCVKPKQNVMSLACTVLLSCCAIVHLSQQHKSAGEATVFLI